MAHSRNIDGRPAVPIQYPPIGKRQVQRPTVYDRSVQEGVSDWHVCWIGVPSCNTGLRAVSHFVDLVIQLDVAIWYIRYAWLTRLLGKKKTKAQLLQQNKPWELHM